jgi:formylglycine-generating enzyme required for sulfatase activity
VRRAALAALLCTGCAEELPPQGHVLLYIDTDAPLPAGPGVIVGGGDAPPLFDTLVVDVIEPGFGAPCADCSRTFALTRDVLERLEASIVVPSLPGRSGYRVRARLYSSESTLAGELPAGIDAAPPQSVIDVVAALPAVEEEGAVERVLVLRTDDVGNPRGTLEQPLATESGPPAASLIGSWAGARRIGCAAPPPPEMVCVPGGAFWMGNPAVDGFGIGNASDRRRLVVMPPYYLDRTEVTVAAYRAQGGEPLTVPSADPAEWQYYCSYSPQPGAREDHPVLCVPFAAARAHCQGRGADLPTEAQYEYAAGALQGRLFVWGSDLPSCSDAVLARVGPGYFETISVSACSPRMDPGGSLPVGDDAAPRRDALVLPGGIVHDLVGNASEWVLDRWNRQEEPCWSHGGVYFAPFCDAASSDGDLRMFRGGSWLVPASSAAAASRSAIPENATALNTVDLGFRCAQPAAPAP